jgi:hypothetical protein
VEIPTFVEDEFAEFYRALFDRQVEEHRMRAVFLEYAWDMSWCDPCAAEPLSRSELADLGVFWLDDRPMMEKTIQPPPRPRPIPRPQNVFVTRLHLRYDGERFPEDLLFQETGDRTNFQGRYVMRHPWTGSDDCPEAKEYRRRLAERREERARTLAELTGWDLDEIRSKMSLTGRAPGSGEDEPWWKRLWPGGDDEEGR